MTAGERGGGTGASDPAVALDATAAALVDPVRLDAWLVAHAPEIGRLRRIEKFAGGQSNPTFLVETSAGRFVLRRKPPGALLKGAHAVEREYRVLAALAETGVPVPRVRRLCEDESVVGTPFYLMDHVAGRVVFDARMPGASREVRAAFYGGMNATLAALHDVDPVAIGLGDFGRPGNWFARQARRWVENYRASEVERRPALDETIAWLEAHLPGTPPPAEQGADAPVSEAQPPETMRLVHGDFRHDNLIVSADDPPRVLALIDWELSTLGPPVADIAYQVAQWRLPAEGYAFKGLGGVDRAALGIPSEEAYLEAYARRRGLASLPDLRFAIVFSLFRLAAILEGVHRRARDGNASNRETGLAYGATVPVLAQLAVDEIEYGGR